MSTSPQGGPDAGADEPRGSRGAGRRSRARAVLVRLAALALAAAMLYYVWPRLVDFLSSSERLADIAWGWFAVMGAAEAGSFACLWLLLRVNVGGLSWFVAATSQLASNAVAKAVPGGTATAGGAQFQMLTAAGVDGACAATGLAVTNIITTATLLAMPLLSLPALLAGARIDPSLRFTALGALVLAVTLLGGGALLMAFDGPVHRLAHVLQRVRNRVAPGRPALRDLPERLLVERDLVRRALGRRWWEALAGATGTRALDFLALVLALYAVGVQPRPALVLIAYVTASVLVMVPVTPGGLGFVELGLAGALGLAGVGAGEAVVATLAYRLVAFWLPLPAGLAAYVLFRVRCRMRAGRGGTGPVRGVH